MRMASSELIVAGDGRAGEMGPGSVVAARLAPWFDQVGELISRCSKNLECLFRSHRIGAPSRRDGKFDDITGTRLSAA